VFSALSLFSGAGGMDLGVRQAGFDILACVEIDPHCCQTLQSAIEKEAPKTILVEQDIREIKLYQFMKDLGLKSARKSEMRTDKERYHEIP